MVAGKYVIEHSIGEGGMGVVFAARHTELDRRVAIKFLLPEFAEQGMAAERFRREARAAARMRGEHVCRVLDVGTAENGVPFMVMEYLEGRDLASELLHRTRLPLEEAVAYVLEACEALAEAHVAGIIHRDLKPANLFLETRSDGSRRIKVLDFGVSKSLLGLKDGTLTRTSSMVGSPLYMSPEQLDSARDVDARADVWALGVVLFELLTGETPFRGESIPQLVAAVLQDSPVRMHELPVRLPQAILDILQRALAKQRENRYASVAELAQALAPFAMPNARMSAERVQRLMDLQGQNAPAALQLERELIGSASAAISHPRTPRVDTHDRSPSLRHSQRSAPRRKRLAVIGVGLFVGLGLAIMLSYAALSGARKNEVQRAGIAPSPSDPPAAAALQQPGAIVPTEPSEPSRDPNVDAIAASANARSASEQVAQPAPAVHAVPRAAVKAPPAAAAAQLPPAPSAPPDPESADPQGNNISDFGGRR
jgi:serine/threonine-protein kinase